MARRYNLKNVRNLLTKGFHDEELRAFCFDQSDFRPVYEQLAEGISKTRLVHLLIEYADRRESVDLLLAWAAEQNPAKYENYKPYYEEAQIAEKTSPLDEPPIQLSIEPSEIKAGKWTNAILRVSNVSNHNYEDIIIALRLPGKIFARKTNLRLGQLNNETISQIPIQIRALPSAMPVVEFDIDLSYFLAGIRLSQTTRLQLTIQREEPTVAREREKVIADFENAYALIIGIANYTHTRRLPSTVVQDANAIYNLLTNPSRCGYQPQNVIRLLDEEATANTIREQLEWLANIAEPGATVFIFFSGHGGRVEENDQSINFLIPYECDPTDLFNTAISGEELTLALRRIQARKLVVLFDACHSGGIGEPKDLSLTKGTFKNGLAASYYEQLSKGRGRIIMASSRSDEVSLILPGMTNSLFTHHLLEAFNGKAHTRGDGLIRILDIFDYVSEAVPDEAPQHPILKASDLEVNFPISLYLGGKQTTPKVQLSRSETTAVNKRELREAIIDSFSLADLEILCADIEQDLIDNGITSRVNLDTVGGTGLDVKVLRLINYLDQRNYLGYLVKAVRQHRPGII